MAHTNTVETLFRHDCVATKVKINIPKWPTGAHVHPIEVECVFSECDKTHDEAFICVRCGRRCDKQCLEHKMTAAVAASFTESAITWICPLCTWLVEKGQEIIPKASGQRVSLVEENCDNELEEFNIVKRRKTDVRRVATWRDTVGTTDGLKTISGKIENRYGPFPVNAKVMASEASQDLRVIFQMIETLLPIAHSSGVACNSIQMALTRLESMRMFRQGTTSEGIGAFQECLATESYRDITETRWKAAMKEAEAADRRVKRKKRTEPGPKPITGNGSREGGKGPLRRRLRRDRVYE